MRPTRLDRSAGELLRRIGVGRRTTQEDRGLSLMYRRAGGAGLILSARTGNERMRLWFDEREWCRWIEPMLVVPDWWAVPAGLREVLAAWTCASAEIDFYDTTDLDWPVGDSVETGHVEPAADWCLRFERAGYQLDARVLDAPSGWLHTLADQLAPLESDTAPDELDNPGMRIPVPLVAGWSRVGDLTVKNLRPGDALLLHQAYAVADGELCLFINRPIAVIHAAGSGTCTIEVKLEDFDDWQDNLPAVPASTEDSAIETLVSVVAEAGSIDVSLDTLAYLKAGDVLTGPVHSSGLVTLKVCGRPIAYGLLLDIDGRLAVRIEHLA